MKSIWRAAVTTVAGIVLVVSCTDSVPTALGPEPVVTNATTTAVPACDLTRTMIADVRSWFPQPERRAAQETMRALSDACAAGDAALVTQYAIALLRSIEALVDAGRGGDAAVGSRLTNALLACTTEDGCTATALPGLDLAPAMSLPAGLFRLYTGEMNGPAVARGVVPFIDFSGRQNAALFGAELSESWSWTEANGGGPLVLLFGKPVTDDPLILREPGFGGLQYDFKRWPASGSFVKDDIVHVAACFVTSVSLPHDEEEESTQPRMQREGTLLSARTPTFCPPTQDQQQASLHGPLIALARAILPARLLAMFSDIRTPVVGGSALDFSRFAPVAAATNGRLEMLSGPFSVATPGQSIGTIVVRALSGGETPMERVRVTLYVMNNQGVPAGAVLVGDPSGYTIEKDGTVTIDDLMINKTGGYTLCARGELIGFSFTDACSGLFHVRK